MKKSIYYWAFYTVLAIVIFQVFIAIAANRRINEDHYELVILANRLFRALVIVIGLYIFSVSPTVRNKGIVLGILTSVIAEYSLHEGYNFTLAGYLEDGGFADVVSLILTPLIFIVVSFISFKRGNFDLAKTFAFATVVIFAYFFIGQLASNFLVENSEY